MTKNKKNSGSKKPDNNIEQNNLSAKPEEGKSGNNIEHNNPSANPEEGESGNKLTVKIVSNYSLLKILDNWKNLCITIGVLLVLVFVALAIVTIIIKRIYPYNDIKVNAFGATTMQKEDVEVIYWLFNTAELWANSGIEVWEGDILTIRASGRSNTAIHHLVEDARNNKEIDNKWVGTDGEGKQQLTRRDSLRTAFRVFDSKPHDALLMQVVDDNIALSSLKDSAEIKKYEKYLRFNYIDYPVANKDTSAYDISVLKKEAEVKNKERYYYIGKERVDLRIKSNGYLYFAVNDVVLTDMVIQKMIDRNRDKIEEYCGNKSDSLSDSAWAKANEECFHFGKHPDKDSISKTYNEMTYYREKHYYNAWFDDNVGSFLIVIERKRSK